MEMNYRIIEKTKNLKILCTVCFADCYLAAAEADAPVAAVDNGKLTGRDTLYGGIAIDVEESFWIFCTWSRACQTASAPAVSVANLEGDVECAFCGPRVACEEVKSCYVETLPVLQQSVVSVTDVEDVLFEVLFYHEPRSAAKPEAFTLTYRVEPITLVLAHFLSCLNFYDIAYFCAEEAAHKVAVVYFSEKANSL